MTASNSPLGNSFVRVHRAVALFTAPNPGPKTLTGTHTYAVGEHDIYIIDPGPDIPHHVVRVAEFATAGTRRARGILLTHGHPDHAPAGRRLAGMLEIPVWASEAMPAEDAQELGVTHRFGDGHRWTVSGDELVALHTPGHTRDHAAFWMPGAAILFAGDTILGRGTTLIAPPEGDMIEYLRTLERLKNLQPKFIAPGHGPMVEDPAGCIDGYIRHRREREMQILEVLQRNPGTVAAIVRRVYQDVDPRLYELAGGSVEAQLIKLEREGRVRRNGVQWHAVLADD